MSKKEDRELLAVLRQLLSRARSMLSDTERTDHSRGEFHQVLRHLEIAAQHMERHIGEPLPDAALPKSFGAIVARLMAGVSPGADNADAGDEEPGTGKFDNAVPLTGSSESVPLPDLISFLQSHQKSGTLKVVGDSELFTIEIENGELVHASSDNPPANSRLGEVLVRQGYISADRLERFLEKYKDRHVKLGEALWREELVDQDSLRLALELQVQQLFHRVFDTEAAYFYFLDGDSESSDVSIRMNVTKLLMESARVHDEAQGVRQAKLRL